MADTHLCNSTKVVIRMKGEIFLAFLRSLRLILVIHTIYNTVQDSREQTLYLPVYQYICIHHWQNHEVFILKKKWLFTFLCFTFPACWWTPFTPSHLICMVNRYRSYFNTICSIWFKLWSLNWYRILVWIGMKSLRKGRRKKQTNHCRCFFIAKLVQVWLYGTDLTLMSVLWDVWSKSS